MVPNFLLVFFFLAIIGNITQSIANTDHAPGRFQNFELDYLHGDSSQGLNLPASSKHGTLPGEASGENEMEEEIDSDEDGKEDGHRSHNASTTRISSTESSRLSCGLWFRTHQLISLVILYQSWQGYLG